MSDDEFCDDMKTSDVGPIEPEYDLSQVRRGLTRLKDEMKAKGCTTPNANTDEDAETAFNQAYCSVITTLIKIAANLQRRPVNPQHCTINLKNAAVQKKFGSYEGALDLLRFCGFEEKRNDDGGSHQLSLAPDSVDEYSTRIDRAVVIMNKVKLEHTPACEEDDSRMIDVPSVNGAASSSVFLANTEEPFSPSAASSSSPTVADEEMKPDLEPDYKIGDVRAALKLLYTEVESSHPPPASSSSFNTPPTPFELALHTLTVRESYCSVLETLAKITQNVMKTPVNPQHLRINLSLPAVKKKFGQYEGAIQYLRFLGFRQQTTEEMNATPTLTSPIPPDTPTNSASTPTPTSNPADPSSLLILPDSCLASSATKFNRALSIVNKSRLDAQPTSEEMEHKSLGPVAREMRVFDLNASHGDPSKLANVNLGAPDEVIEEQKADMGLLLAANMAERKRIHELARTDVIITKQKMAELKEAAKRKYSKTLIKITFSDKIATNKTQQQGHGRWSHTTGGGVSSSIRQGTGYVLGQPAITADASTTLSPPVPPSPASASASTPTGALSPSTSSTPSAPAPEVMLTAYFRPWETLADLMLFVTSHLVHGEASEPFYLHLPPNLRFQWKGEDKTGKYASLMTKSLSSLGLVPAASMYFHYCSTPSTVGAIPSLVDSLKPEVLCMKEGYDVAILTRMIPIAENKAELEAMKAKALAEERERARMSSMEASAASSSSSAHQDNDDDIEAYMRRKKAAAAKSSSSASSGRPAGSSGSSNSASAASKRVIPGLFKPK